MHNNIDQIVDDVITSFMYENPNPRTPFISILKGNRGLLDFIVNRGTDVFNYNRNKISVRDGIFISLLYEYFSYISQNGYSITNYDSRITPAVVSSIENTIDALSAPVNNGYSGNQNQSYIPPTGNQGRYSSNRAAGYETAANVTRTTRMDSAPIQQYQPPANVGRQSSAAETALVNLTSRTITFGIIPVVTTTKEDYTMNKDAHDQFYDKIKAAKATKCVEPPIATIDNGVVNVDKKEQVKFDISTPISNRLIDQLFPIENKNEEVIERYTDVEQWFATRGNDLKTLAKVNGRYMYYGEVTLAKELRVLDNDNLDMVVDNLSVATLATIDNLLGGLESNNIIHRIDGNILRRSILDTYNSIVLTRLSLTPAVFCDNLSKFTTRGNTEVIPLLKKNFEDKSTSPILDSLDFEAELQRAISEVLGTISVASISETEDKDNGSCVVFDRTIGIGYISIPITDFMFGDQIVSRGYCMATSDTLKDLKNSIMGAIDLHDAFVLMTSDGYIVHITSIANDRNGSYGNKNTAYGGVIFVSEITTTTSYNRIMELYKQL